MKNRVSLSTWSYLKMPAFEALEKIYSLGFKCVELWGDYPHFWAKHFLKKNNLAKLKSAMKKFTGQNSIHAPMVNIIDKNIGLREEALTQMKETITLAGELGIKYMTMHTGAKFPGMQGWDYEKESFEILVNCLVKLGSFAKKHNVSVCIENVPEEFGFSACKMSKLIKKITLKNIFMTFDIGHANLLGHEEINTFFAVMKNKIKIMHIDDNCGAQDNHLPIGSGNIRFCDFFNKNLKYLKNINLAGEFAFNKKNPDYASKSYLNFAGNFNLL